MCLCLYLGKWQITSLVIIKGFHQVKLMWHLRILLFQICYLGFCTYHICFLIVVGFVSPSPPFFFFLSQFLEVLFMCREASDLFLAYDDSDLCGLHWGFGLFLTILLLIDENMFLVFLLTWSAGLINVDILACVHICTSLLQLTNVNKRQLSFRKKKKEKLSINTAVVFVMNWV